MNVPLVSFLCVQKHHVLPYNHVHKYVIVYWHTTLLCHCNKEKENARVQWKDFKTTYTKKKSKNNEKKKESS